MEGRGEKLEGVEPAGGFAGWYAAKQGFIRVFPGKWRVSIGCAGRIGSSGFRMVLPKKHMSFCIGYKAKTIQVLALSLLLAVGHPRGGFMRILVTGGAGFIGSHLVRALLRQGDEVVVFDRVPVPHLLQDIMDSITYVQGDSASDLDLYRAVATNGIEGIFHLGALMAGVCEQNPPLAFQVNFRSTQVLLDAAVACGVKRFFFMSSISLYSPTSVEPVPEDAPKDPATIYGQTKLAGEHLLRWYADNHGIDSRGIRPTWVWGPNRTNGLTTQYTTGLVDSIARGGEVHVDNPGRAGRLDLHP